MTNKKSWLTAVGVLTAAFAVTPAFGQPADSPGKGAEKSAKAAEKAAERAETRAAKAEEKAEKAETRADKAAARAEDKAARAEEKADAKHEHGRGPGHEPGTDPQPGHGADRRGHGFRYLGSDFKDGKVTKADLKDRIAALHASKSDRRKENREGLKKRWGAILAHPACREELRHHARREAFLSRALFLVQTEASIKDKDKVIERINKLIEKEEARHARAMERLKSAPGATAPEAPAAAPNPPSTPTPAAAPEKAGAK